LHLKSVLYFLERKIVGIKEAQKVRSNTKGMVKTKDLKEKREKKIRDESAGIVEGYRITLYINKWY